MGADRLGLEKGEGRNNRSGERERERGLKLMTEKEGREREESWRESILNYPGPNWTCSTTARPQRFNLEC